MSLRSCREASALALGEADRQLRPLERWRLAVHRLFCPPCRVFRHQLATLRTVMGQLEQPAPSPPLEDAARQRIREKLAAARKASGSGGTP